MLKQLALLALAAVTMGCAIRVRNVEVAAFRDLTDERVVVATPVAAGVPTYAPAPVYAPQVYAPPVVQQTVCPPPRVQEPSRVSCAEFLVEAWVCAGDASDQQIVDAMLRAGVPHPETMRLVAAQRLRGCADTRRLR